MKYRKLGDSDVTVSAVVLGAWAIGGWMWGGTDDENAIAGVRRGIDLGMTSIDTAPVYGFGHSETVIGQAISGIKTRFNHQTSSNSIGRMMKVSPFRQTERQNSANRACDASNRLYRPVSHRLQHPHRRNYGGDGNTAQAGKISGGREQLTAEEMTRPAKCFRLQATNPCSMVWGHKNSPYCIDNNVAVIVYSPLQLGLLSGKMTMDRVFKPDDLRSKSPYFTPENRQKVINLCDRLKPIASSYGATIAQLVINWTINRTGITAALVGSRNATQAQENAGSADFKLSSEDKQAITEMVDGLSQSARPVTRGYDQSCEPPSSIR